MRITENKLLLDYYRGIKAQERHPCTLCNAGITFSDVPHFHGSDFGKCIRAVQWEKYTTKREAFDDHTSAFLRDGHVHEAAVVDTLRHAGYEITDRDGNDEFVAVVDVDSGSIFCSEGVDDPNVLKERVDRAWSEMGGDNLITIVGHTDGVINGEFLFECKAVKDYAFEQKFKQRKLPPKYIGQMQCYMVCKNLAGGVLWVKARHTAEPLPFLIDRDDKFFLNKARELHSVVELQGTDNWLPCKPTETIEQRWCKACKALKKH